jgi:hypothetical protein
MRTSQCVVLLLVLLLAAGAAQAQPAPAVITVNESGTGTLQFPPGSPIPLSGILSADPGPGGLASALTYNLLGPPSLVAGDVILLETGDTLTVRSDIVRFNPAGTGAPGYPASLLFYSDTVAGSEALADTGFPSVLYTNVVTLLEIGPEGSNGFLGYTPTANQPGFVAGFAVTYNLISDGTTVPEPAAVLLVAVGGGLLFVKRRWGSPRT